MRVLCQFDACGPSMVRSGWGRVFLSTGHDFKFWLPSATSIHDAIYEHDPHLLISCTYSVDEAMVDCIRRRPDMKVILFASAWGDLIEKIDLTKYPIVVAQHKEIKLLEQLKKETGKPDFVFIHVTDKYLEGTMGGWTSIGVKPIGILNAADAILYANAKYREELACDWGFVGGLWNYKSKNLDRFLLPLCNMNVDNPLRIKIFGNQKWPVPQYLGACSDEVNRDLLKSALVCPNVSEPHSTDDCGGWDIVERPFKSMFIGGGITISDYVDEARELFTEDELIMCKTPKDFQETIRHFVKNPDERLPYIERGQKAVMKAHTYHDRVAKMLEHLDMPNERQAVLDKKEMLGDQT